MRFFVNPHEFVQIHEIPGDSDSNTVWIKAKMNWKTTAAVQRELLELQISTNQGDEGKISATVGVEGRKLTLLKHNIVRWKGPDFIDERGKAIPCTIQRIESLNPHEPFFHRVVEEIEERNQEETLPLTEEEARGPTQAQTEGDENT